MEGNGLVYNPGEKIEGYTNFLWTIITAPFTKLNFADVAIFSTILCFIISLLNVYLLMLIGGMFYDNSGEYSKFIILIPPLLFVLDGTIAFWVIAGMELPMFTLFILGVFYNYFRIYDNSRYVNYMILFLILATLTRPEGNMIFALTILHMIIFSNRIHSFRFVVLKVIIFYFIFCLIYYGFKYFYYGQILPNTFYAKGVTDLGMNLILGTKYIIMCSGLRFYILIFIFFIPFKQVMNNFRLSYLILFSAVYVIYIVLVGGDWMYANRFFVPVIPALYLLSAIGMYYFIIKLKNYFTSNPGFNLQRFNLGVDVFIISLCIILVFVSFIRLEYKTLIIHEDNARFEKQWQRFGEWLKIYCDPRTVIAVGPAGKIPYYSGLYSIDMWGLNHEYIARTKSKRLQAGHKKYDFEYILSQNPEFIIGYAGFTNDEVPDRYVKFNPDDEYYKCMDIVFRLKKEYRTYNKDN